MHPDAQQHDDFPLHHRGAILNRSSAVSYLFVPGTRTERFERALNSGADRVIIDLEDAVANTDKSVARSNITEAITRGLSAPVLIRINPDDSEWFDGDIRLIHHLAATQMNGLRGIVIPKLERSGAVDRVRLALGEAAAHCEIIGMIETAVGVDSLAELVSSGVTQLAVGAVDLSVDLGAEIDSVVIDWVYSHVVVASRVAGLVAPIGSPPLSLHDDAGNELEARRLKSMGLSGQLCIHPAQILPIHVGFSPTAAQIEWAQRVLASEGAAAQVDGQMVDKPVRDRAVRIIERVRSVS